MTRKSIVTNQAVIACDVCGRTLLRGEHADVFLHAGARRTVCELCTSRAVHEGWLREGLDAGLGRPPRDRGTARSLLGRLRTRRLADGSSDPLAPGGGEQLESRFEEIVEEWPARPADPVVGDEAAYEPPREPRQVHAVPTNADLKVSRALEVFNASPHRRTVGGVSRSLGAPVVSARPSNTEGSVVSIVVGWELSWYRYEVDLGDEASGVRVVAQGTELAELEAEDRESNAAADESGGLHLAASPA